MKPSNTTCLQKAALFTANVLRHSTSNIAFVFAMAGLLPAITCFELHARTETTHRTSPAGIGLTEPSVSISVVTNEGVYIDAGDQVRFTIMLNNTGSAPAYNLRVTNALPSASAFNHFVSFEAVEMSASTCDNLGGGFTVDAGSAPNVVFTFDELPANTSCSITFTGIVTIKATPNETYNNQATLNSYNNQPDVNAPDIVTYTGGSSSSVITTKVPAILQTYTSTSEAHTDPGDTRTGASNATEVPLAIGEIIHFKMELTLIEGLHNNFLVEDLLPTGMEALYNSNFKVTVPTGVITGNSALTSGATTSIYNDSGTLLVTFFNLSPNAGSLSFFFGAVTSNTNTNNSVSEVIIVEFDAIVLNTTVASNDIGDQRDNQATLNEGSGTFFVSSNTLHARIQEPVVNINKTLNTILSNPAGVGMFQFGDEVVYDIVLTAGNAANQTTAFDLNVLDNLPADLDLVSVAWVGTPVYATTTDNSDYTAPGQSVDVSITELRPGDAVTIRVTTTIALNDCITTPNSAATMTYTSLPGLRGTNDAAPGNSGTARGERNGSGGVNDYMGSDGTNDNIYPNIIWYKDVDNDGYAQTGAAPITQCDRPTGYKLAAELLAISGDCNDDNAAINPGASEICDGVDNDCDGSTDEDVTTRYYYDNDQDGYGQSDAFSDLCAPTGFNTALVGGDCDDSDNTIYPTAPEICDNKDNDCNSLIDDGLLIRYYYDNDQDDYGESNDFIDRCSGPTGLYTALVGGDCNDNDNTIYPDAPELCDDQDNDCDGMADEDLSFTRYYLDLDGDGYGQTSTFGDFCALSGFYTALVGGDCDDDDVNVNPGETEICNGIDDDCDGTADDGITFVTYYQDSDGDGFGNPSASQSTCDGAPTGYVTNNTDCNDNSALDFPGQEWYADSDNDGYSSGTTLAECLRPVGYKVAGELTATFGDCNDSNSAINPGATETCNGMDDDCNGLTDEGLTTRYYYDFDGDGYGEAVAFIDACAPSGFYTATVDGDCLADDADVYPGATEICDGKDNDCDGTTDEGFITRYFYDIDGDGYGQVLLFIDACAPGGLYTATVGGDCNDDDASVNPGAMEVCNDIDDDCDGVTDNGFPIIRYYYDGDADGFGESGAFRDICGPLGFFTATVGGDCNDGDHTIYPDAPELCDGKDNDCDGATDEGVTTRYYYDFDQDGYGQTTYFVDVCVPNDLFTALEGGDCDDSNPAINPGATETCNGMDDDCDGLTDEGLTSRYYYDLDGDGYGEAYAFIDACAPSGFYTATVDGDCVADDADVYPGAQEICDGKDNDCDGLTDTDDPDLMSGGALSIFCPTVQTLILYGVCSATLPDYTALANVIGGCGTVTVTQMPAPGTTVSQSGPMTVTLKASDESGSSQSCTFTVNKLDVTPPSVLCFNGSVTFNGQATIALDTDALSDSADGCGIQSISLSPNTISAMQVGQNVPVTITVTDINGNTASCNSQVTVSGLPEGWSQNPDGIGCAGGNSNTYNPATGVWTASSTNCFYASPYTSDASSFAQRSLCGNGSITTLVTDLSGNGWAGVVMRESNAPGAKKVQLMTNRGQFHRREFRTATNGQAFPQQIPSNGRYWLRIVRAGNQFTMFASANGMGWFPIGAQTIVMADCIQMGMVVTNYTANSTVTAMFEGVSYSGSNVGLGTGSIGQRAESIDAPHSIEVYPNPTSGELNIDLTQYIGRSVRIELYSVEGKLLQFSEIEEVQTVIKSLNLAPFENGMYLAKVKSAGWPDITKRVVLARE